MVHDFVEITSNDNWFKQHPEKIAGVEYETTSYFFPIMVKGTKEDVLRVTGITDPAVRVPTGTPIEIQESRVRSAQTLLNEAKTAAAKTKAMRDLQTEQSRFAELKAYNKAAENNNKENPFAAIASSNTNAYKEKRIRIANANARAKLKILSLGQLEPKYKITQTKNYRNQIIFQLLGQEDGKWIYLESISDKTIANLYAKNISFDDSQALEKLKNLGKLGVSSQAVLKGLAKKYININNQIETAQNNRDKFEGGYYYNPVKADMYSEKVDELYKKLSEVESELSKEQKTQIEDYYECGQMFD